MIGGGDRFKVKGKKFYGCLSRMRSCNPVTPYNFPRVNFNLLYSLLQFMSNMADIFDSYKIALGAIFGGGAYLIFDFAKRQSPQSLS